MSLTLNVVQRVSKRLCIRDGLSIIEYEPGWNEKLNRVVVDEAPELSADLDDPEVDILLRAPYTPPEKIAEQLVDEYGEQTLSMEQLVALVKQRTAEFLQAGLLCYDDGTTLPKRSPSWAARLRGVFFIRVPLFNPERSVEVLHHLFGKWFFSLPCFIAMMFLMFVAAVAALSNLNLFSARYANLSSFAQHNFAEIFVAIIVTKVIHEYGHALAGRKFGYTSRQMGLYILVLLTPCFYCNLDESRRETSCWKNIVIALGGIYFELVISSVALLFWVSYPEGSLSGFLFAVILSCSVSTLLFNINPFLRFDGYYVAESLMGIPNLRLRAAHMRQAYLAWFLSGKRDYLLRNGDVGKPYGHLLLGYSLLQSIVVWLLVFSILRFLYQLAEPYGFEGFIMAFGAWTLVLTPLYSFVRFAYNVSSRVDVLENRTTLEPIGI
jgi:putative peptide zinc metalloprotease protein